MPQVHAGLSDLGTDSVNKTKKGQIDKQLSALSSGTRAGQPLSQASTQLRADQ